MKLLKKSLRRCTSTPGFSAFVSAVEALPDRRPNLLRVLTYHRVDHRDANPRLDPRLLSATPKQFKRQMEYLAERCNVVDIDAVLQAFQGSTELPPRSVLITFDDAYQDFAENAWPILRELRLPVTLFVPTDFPGQDGHRFWWDRLYGAINRNLPQNSFTVGATCYAIDDDASRYSTFLQLVNRVESLPHVDGQALVDEVCQQLSASPMPNCVLDWSALHELSRSGVTLAPHTMSHPRMAQVSLLAAREEAVGSRKALQTMVGDCPPVFSYPAGVNRADVSQMLADEAFELAFTTRRGLNDVRTSNRMLLRRINVSHRTSNALWRAQLLRTASVLNPIW